MHRTKEAEDEQAAALVRAYPFNPERADSTIDEYDYHNPPTPIPSTCSSTRGCTYTG